MAATILIVDDEPDIRETIGEILADEEFRPLLAANADEARRLREEHEPDLILLDVWMPDTDGISLLKQWRSDVRDLCPVVMISGHGSVEAAVEATRFGARDFIEKPVSMARLLDTVRKALSARREPATREGLEAGGVPDPTGRSEPMIRLRERLEAVRTSSAPILVIGEPGSGRTTVAHWLHARGRGGKGRRIDVVCGPGGNLADGLPEALAAAEKAPATLVVERLEAANVDERAMLSGALERLPPLLMLIATATPELDALAHEGRFETDLLQRIAANRVDVPPLRDRRDDIPDLVRDLAERLPADERLPYRPIPVPAQNLLRQHDWPGNLRELTNVVRALLQVGGEAPVEPDEVASTLAAWRHDEAEAAVLHSPLFELPLREAREAFERQYLIARLRRVDGSVGQLAEAVEMERTHLYRKLRQLGIDPKQVQEEAS
jgi:DNA-binding NtrC family response regulator